MAAFEERYYQVEADDAIHAYYNSGARGDVLIALPTGTGKAYCIANFIKRAMFKWPNQKFMMLTASSTLVRQNAETLEKHWPFCPLGINSDELGSRDTMHSIIFGSIASCYRSPEAFGHRDVLIIDEAHNINIKDATMYRAMIAGLRKKNPRMIVIGYTATPFRAGQGMLTEGDDRLFDIIVYDQTGIEAFNRMIKEGYLSPLVPRPMQTKFDMSKVHKSRGDYNQSEAEEAINKDEITLPALDEIIKWGDSRHCWLIFAAGLKHADRVAKLLTDRGYPCAAIHSKKTKDENDKNMALFKAGKLRGLVNYGKLTTGFDHAPIDMLVILRATTSANLWVQMLGRGTRPYDCYNPMFYKVGFNYIKQNCLVLDFARNTATLGTINDPKIPKPKGKGTGETPVKICETEKLVNPDADGCGAYNHTSARFCCGCGEEFKATMVEAKEASTAELVTKDRELPVMESFNITSVRYRKHMSKSGNETLRVTYICGYRIFEEYILVEHSRMRYKAKQWWQMRSHDELPSTVQEAYELIEGLREPKSLLVWMNAPDGPKINSVEFVQ